MDALELLRTDHDRVNNLFQQIQSARDASQKRQLFTRIRSELDAHTHIEETVLYPVFSRYEETKQIVEHSFKEHSEVKSLLQEIDGIKAAGPEMDARLQKLIDSVTHHVEEEESKLFPLIRKMMKRPEREQLGRHLQAAKQERPMAA